MPILDLVCMGWWFEVETKGKVVKVDDSCVDSGKDVGAGSTDEGSRWDVLELMERVGGEDRLEVFYVSKGTDKAWGKEEEIDTKVDDDDG